MKPETILTKMILNWRKQKELYDRKWEVILMLILRLFKRNSTNITDQFDTGGIGYVELNNKKTMQYIWYVTHSSIGLLAF